MAKVIIHYDPLNGLTFPDSRNEHLVDEIVNKYQQGQDVEVVFGNEIPIYYVRLAVKKGNLNWEDVTFHYGDIVLPVNKDGRLPRWPKGFCDYIETVLSQL